MTIKSDTDPQKACSKLSYIRSNFNITEAMRDQLAFEKPSVTRRKKELENKKYFASLRKAAKKLNLHAHKPKKTLKENPVETTCNLKIFK